MGRKDTIFAGQFSYMQTLSRPASTVRLIFNRLSGDPVLLVSSSHPLPNTTHNDLYLDASTPNEGVALPDGTGYKIIDAFHCVRGMRVLILALLSSSPRRFPASTQAPVLCRVRPQRRRGVRGVPLRRIGVHHRRDPFVAHHCGDAANRHCLCRLLYLQGPPIQSVPVREQKENALARLTPAHQAMRASPPFPRGLSIARRASQAPVVVFDETKKARLAQIKVEAGPVTNSHITDVIEKVRRVLRAHQTGRAWEVTNTG